MELKVGERVERMGRGEGEEGDYCHEWSVERGPLWYHKNCQRCYLSYFPECSMVIYIKYMKLVARSQHVELESAVISTNGNSPVNS